MVITMKREKIFLLRGWKSASPSTILLIHLLMLHGVLSDYGHDERLDKYDAEGLDDNEDIEEMSVAARRAAEAKMARRDRAEGGARRGARAARRARAPAFLQSEESEEEEPGAGLLAGMKKRTRRHYDERRDIDDAEGVEDEIPLEQLGDIKANSIAEWIEVDSVKRSIVKHFRHFLMTYVDENGSSVYGERIKHLGEG
jgi:DNA replication licensing factor MCM2